MKKIIAYLVFFLGFSVSANAQTPEFRLIRDGIEHAQFTRQIKISETENAPVAVNLLRLDLKKVRLDVVHALDAAIGLEKTSSIAARHGAFAAINAGFFKIEGEFKGDAAGSLKINGKILSESFADRVALGIINRKKKTEVVFGHLEADALLAYAGNLTKKFDGINRERKDDEIILYTPAIKQTPQLKEKAIEIIFRDCNTFCRKIEFAENTGGTPIPPKDFAVSTSLNRRNEYFIEKMKKLADADLSKLKEKVFFFDVLRPKNLKNQSLPLSALSKKFAAAEDVVAGVPQLIKDGKIEITWEREKIGKAFAETRHPRTAVAKLKNGKFLMAAIDGRQPEHSVGMNLQELAEMLLEFGATDAINLDGGGSTTMFLDGKIVNKPSDKTGERNVSDAILVFPRKKS